jgi:hypothetical protein
VFVPADDVLWDQMAEMRGWVKATIGWIQGAGNKNISVITDHLYANRPPALGWPVWMMQEVDKADVVFLPALYCAAGRINEAPIILVFFKTVSKSSYVHSYLFLIRKTVKINVKFYIQLFDQPIISRIQMD